MILARNSITLHHLRDITTVVWYYKLQASTASPPTKPTTATPSGWTTTEPTYTEGSTNSLYVCQQTTFSDGTFEYSDVSLSSSYEAAKAAYAKSVQAKETADAAQAAADELTPELIVGTHGTTATATWTGTSTVLSEIKAGTRIQYKLSSAGASNVTLNLTLKDGSTTGAKPVYYLNTTRLGTQYGVNAVVDLVYDGSAWRVLNPYTNSNTVGSYAGVVKAGANGVYNYSLVMRDTADTWVSLTTSAGTGTSKARYTGGLYPDKVLYMGSNAAYAEGATTGTCYDALALNLNYSTNSGSGLTVGKAVYLVGEIHSDGLFYLDSTWWTQTVPTTANGKTYIYLGLAYNTSNIYLSSENTAFVYYDGKFRTLREADELKAAKVADNYLSSDNTGIMVADMTDGNTYTPSNVPSGVKNTYIDKDSFQVRDGTDVLACFGEESQIGKDDENHLSINATGIQGVNENGDTLLNIDMDGGQITLPIFTRVDIDPPLKSQFDMTTLSCRYTFPNVPAEALDGRYITWNLKVILTKADGSKINSGSFVTVKCGKDSNRTWQTGSVFSPVFYKVIHTYTSVYSSASSENECFATFTILKNDSTEYVSAECWCEYYDYYKPRDVKAPTFSLGTRRDAEVGAFSGTIGESLSAHQEAQFACGKNNLYNENYAFMVGNGNLNEDSNAFAVTWDGNQLIALDETATSGTDAELYSAITSLGWESEVLYD